MGEAVDRRGTQSLARGVRLFFTHDTGCAMAAVQRDDKGRYSTMNEMPELSGTPLPA